MLLNVNGLKLPLVLPCNATVTRDTCGRESNFVSLDENHCPTPQNSGIILLTLENSDVTFDTKRGVYGDTIGF